MTTKTDTQSRFTDLIARLEAAEGPAECIEWTWAKDNQGRGRLWVNDKLKLAHRVVWEHVNGPIPAGKLLCHHCDNPSCFNPVHLYVGTQKDNMRDMMNRGRHWATKNPEAAKQNGRRTGLKNDWVAGEGNPQAKLTKQQVAHIRNDPRATRYIAAEYGIDRTTVQRIRSGKLWGARKAIEARS